MAPTTPTRDASPGLEILDTDYSQTPSTSLYAPTESEDDRSTPPSPTPFSNWKILPILPSRRQHICSPNHSGELDTHIPPLPPTSPSLHMGLHLHRWVQSTNQSLCGRHRQHPLHHQQRT